MNEKKDFDGWMALKRRLHFIGRIPDVLEREVWWAAIGENVGIEINGKSKRFSRPVLILKKFTKLGFMVIPLTTKSHDGSPWYVPFEFKGEMSYAVLSQARVISVSRLLGHSIGRLPKSDFNKINEKFIELYKPRNP